MRGRKLQQSCWPVGWMARPRQDLKAEHICWHHILHLHFQQVNFEHDEEGRPCLHLDVCRTSLCIFICHLENDCLGTCGASVVGKLVPGFSGHTVHHKTIFVALQSRFYWHDDDCDLIRRRLLIVGDIHSDRK